jgi:transcriptional regulator with XRE-family HTH domain
MSVSIKKDTGRRIRQIRASLKLTQAQMAELLQVSTAAISAWELGDSGISIEAAIRLATLGEVSMDYIFRGSSEGAATKIHEDLTPEEQQLLSNFRSSDKADQAALLRIAAATATKKRHK